MRKINRVKSLQIDNFRGIKTLQQPLNTDADVVLINGPNGFGKTSLVDALNVLLNGYYYSERGSLLCLCGNTPIQEAMITAKVLYDDGKDGDINVRVTDKNLLELTADEYYWPPENRREITARASFFYQDLLNRLFDEEGAEKTLKEFLAPSPLQVQDTLKEIALAKKDLSHREKRIFDVPGVISQEEVERERQQAVKDFIAIWNELALLKELLGAELPTQMDEEWFNEKGELRDEWRFQLIKLFNNSRVFSPEQFDEVLTDGAPIMILQRLGSLLQVLQTTIINKTDIESKLSVIINTLPDHAELIPREKLTQETERLSKLSNWIAMTKERVKQLLIIERHFQYPDGPGLLDILLALHDKGREWLQLPEALAVAMKPPAPVLEWLNGVMESFYFENRSMDGYMQVWQEGIRKERQKEQESITKEERSYQEGTKLLSIAMQLYELTETFMELRVLINRENSQGRAVSKEMLVSILDQASNSRAYPAQVIKAVFQSISNWITVEEKSTSREDNLRKARELEKAQKYLDGIRQALERESSKNSLINMVQILPEHETERFVKLVNELFSRFRIVSGLYPVKLIPGQKGIRRDKVETWDIVMADGRPLSCLSTGQKAQLGLSLLLGLNIALDELMPHRILALDDSTTAFDMAQLPREAALLRQIVYGVNDGDGAGKNTPRRQLFIVSHHEDLTHRLIDFLIPPENKSMHILNFINWDPNQGPETEQRLISPARSANIDSRREFSGFLNYVLGID